MKQNARGVTLISSGDIVHVFMSSLRRKMLKSRRAPRVLCNLCKQNRASAPDAQNIQDSYLNQLLRLNICRYQSISGFDSSIMTYF